MDPVVPRFRGPTLALWLLLAGCPSAGPGNPTPTPDPSPSPTPASTPTPTPEPWGPCNCPGFEQTIDVAANNISAFNVTDPDFDIHGLCPGCLEIIQLAFPTSNTCGDDYITQFEVRGGAQDVQLAENSFGGYRSDLTEPEWAALTEHMSSPAVDWYHADWFCGGAEDEPFFPLRMVGRHEDGSYWLWGSWFNQTCFWFPSTRPQDDPGFDALWAVVEDLVGIYDEHIRSNLNGEGPDPECD